MASSKENKTNSTTIPSELKAEQALGLVGLGLMQKISKEYETGLNWFAEEESDNAKADLLGLKQRLELTALAIETGAPLTTSEVSHLLGARPGSPKTKRGGLLAERISRNVWKLTKSEGRDDSSYWRN